MKVKIISYTLTLVLQFLSIVVLKLLDNFYPIIIIFLCSLVSGLIIRYAVTPDKKIIKDLGWGLLFGSITSLVLIVGFVIWLADNFPK